MKGVYKALALTILAVVVFSSCGKYEDGPMVSFIPKKTRLQKQWMLDERYINGTQMTLTADDKDDYFELKSDGSYEFTQVVGSASAVTMTGTWELTSSKEKVVITSTFLGININVEYTILRLTSKELWVEYTNTQNELEEDHLIVR